MKSKRLKNLISIILFILLAGGLLFFHTEYGLWWDRTDFGKDIEKIVISAGGFTPPPPVGGEYIDSAKTLMPESPEYQNIVKAIESGWKYKGFAILKTESYVVDITHTDGSQTTVDVLGNFMRVKSQGDVQIFRAFRNVSEIIETELEMTK